MNAAANPPRDPLLAEWACLGAVYDQPCHGFAISKRLSLAGDLGRVWHVSRPLTYRALDQLRGWDWIEPRGEQAGAGGPNRTLLAATSRGRAHFATWVTSPVEHVRDVRSELLLKIVLADEHGIDIVEMLERQQELLAQHADALESSPEHLQSTAPENDPAGAGASASGDDTGDDIVVAWRREMTFATRRFVAELHRRHLPHSPRRRPSSKSN